MNRIGATGLALAGWALIAAGCPAPPPDPAPPSEPPRPLDALRLGGCAPVRYRPVPEEQLEAEPPPRARYQLGFRPRWISRLPNGPAISSRLRREVGRLENTLIGCLRGRGVEPGRPINVRMSLDSRGSVTYARAAGSRDHAADRCLGSALRSRVRDLPAPGRRVLLTFDLQLSERPTSRSTRPPRVSLVSASDRVAASLAVTAALAASLPDLRRCLSADATGEPAAVTTHLAIEAGAVADAEVAAPSKKLGECLEDRLRRVATDDIELGGPFECGLAVGRSRADDPEVVLEVGDAAARVSGPGRPPRRFAWSELEAPPPASPLYRELLEHRFAGVHAEAGPRPATLALGGGARGSQIARAVRALAAADFRVAAIDGGRERRRLLAMPAMPIPQLSGNAGRAARPTIIVEPDGLWIGLAADLASAELPAGEPKRLAEALRRLRRHPGTEHRRDLVVGVAAGVGGTAIAETIEAAREGGFDQVRLLTAEVARARLAR